MEMLCPVCQSLLQAQDEGVYCDRCQRRYQQLAVCPDCGQPLDVLKACGAVDYFCSHGDGLISKRRIDLTLVPR